MREFVLPDVIEANKDKRIFGIFNIHPTKEPIRLSHGRHQNAGNSADLWTWDEMMVYLGENQLPSVSLIRFAAETGMNLIIKDLDAYKDQYDRDHGDRLIQVAEDLGTHVAYSSSGKGYHTYFFTRETGDVLTALKRGGARKSKGIDNLGTYAILSGKPYRNNPVQEIILTDEDRELMCQAVEQARQSDGPKALLEQNGRMSIVFAANLQVDIATELVNLGFEERQNGRWQSPDSGTSAGGMILPSHNGPYDIFITYNETGLDWMKQGKSGRVADGTDLRIQSMIVSGKAKNRKHALSQLYREINVPVIDNGNFYGELKDQTVDEYNSMLEIAPPAPQQLPSDSIPFSDLPMPTDPFLIEVVEWIMNSCMPYRQRDIAIHAAWNLAMVFVGRKDSFHENPPVVPSILLAPSTTGKDTIRKALQVVIRALTLDGFNHAVMFEPIGSAKGQVKLVELGLRKLSGIQLISEAGVALDSKAGDPHSVRSVTLQNTAANAYTSWYTEELREVKQVPIGVNIPVVSESTVAAYKKHLPGSADKGDAGRRLLFNINHAKVEWYENEPDWQIPEKLVSKFRLLAEEAVRSENINLDPVGATPIPEFRRFKGDEEVVEFFRDLRRREFERRSTEDSETFGLREALAGRYIQLLMRLALLSARTRLVTSGHPSETTVSMQDVKQAKALLDDSRKTEMANQKLHEGPEQQLADAWLSEGQREFSRSEPSGQFIGKHRSGKRHASTPEELWAQHRLTSGYFTGQVERTKKLGKDLARENKIHPTELYKRTIELGEASGYWNVSVEGRSTWLIFA
ncbi:hypothetical protein GCM10011360_02680 [Primorskyibacter flagellatus]|uniref:Uncharacterized protein n=1 Tax=Primorskyibacter flagellatus TaxID=1387277 RepID=A0A916ZXC5_9RHOB|nr:hypothetical protein [Primorskyibacter flagellatus]GGE17329.1 hypothetical protein GCM10011360_02680 [Primorskyibacter flagellatus]